MQPDNKSRRVPLRLETLGAALEQKLQNEAEILDVLVSAVQRGQDHPDLWAKLDAAAARDDRQAELAFAYERLSRDKKLAKLPSAVQADILARIGTFFADAFGDPDGAEVYLQQAIGLSPAHPMAFAKLEALLIRKQEGLRLGDLYAAAAVHKSDKADQVAMLRRALELCEGFGSGEDERQIRLFLQILKLDPTDRKVRSSLEEAYLRTGKGAELAKFLEQSLHGDTLNAADQKNARERLLDVYVEKLREPEKSIAHVEELLKMEPESAVALKAGETLLSHKVLAPRAAAALGAAYEKAGLVADTARCLAVEVDHYRGPRRVEAQKKLAALKFQKLGDLGGALALYEQVVVLDASDDEVRERYRSLCAAMDKSLDATRVLTRALAGAKDPALRARIGVEIGEIFMELGDSKRAKVAFQQVLESGGTDAEVLRATRAVAKLAFEMRDTKSLANALGKLSTSAPDPEERARVAAELGKLYETDLSDTQGAIDAWRKVLGSSRDRDALVALSRLYQATGALKELAQVLDRRADTEVAADARKQVLLEVAELRATKLSDRPGAIDALRRVIAKGAEREATQKLLPLLEQERRWEELATTLEMDAGLAPTEERAAIEARLGQLRLARLHDVPGAIRAFGAALSADRFEKNSRLALEKILGGPALEAVVRDPKAGTTEDRLAAATLLEGVYRAEGAASALVRVLEAKTSLLTDANERLGALEEASEVMEREAQDLKRAFDLAVRGLKEAVAHAQERVLDWLSRVERLGEKAADTPKRAEALASALGDAEVQSQGMFELAKKAGEGLVHAGDVARALPILRRALAFEPGSQELVARIDTLLKEQGSPEERVALYRTLLQKPQEPDRRRDLLHVIAAIQRRDLGDATGAIETYRKILSTHPDDVTAQDALLEAYSETGQSEALYSELGARLFKAQAPDRPPFLMRLADVAAQAGWTQRAAEHYHEALAGGAQLTEERLTSVENLGVMIGDSRLVRLVLTRRVELSTTPEEEALWLERLAQHETEALHDRIAAAASFKRAARLVEEMGNDEDRARRLYERAIAALPDDTAAATRLVDLYDRSSELWSSLPGVHEVLIRAADTQEGAVAALLAFEPAAVKARASGVFSSAVASIGKRHGPIAAGLWRQVQAAMARVLGSDVERQDEAAAVYRAMVENAPSESKKEREAFEAFLDAAPDTLARRVDKRWLFDLKARAATTAVARAKVLCLWAVDEERGGDTSMAIELTERALGEDPDCEEALVARSRLLLAHGEFEKAAEALEARRDRAEGEPRLALERELCTLRFERLSQVEEALVSAARILEADPTDVVALDVAELSMASAEFVVRGAELLARAAQAVADPEASGAILRKIVLSSSFRAPELAASRPAWVLKLLECLSERPEEALDVALLGVTACRFEWPLWERAEKLARDMGRPDAVAAAYRTAVDGEGEPAPDVDTFEELGRRAVDFHEEWFDEPENVALLLRRMVERAPAPGWAFERLKLVYNAGEQWNELFQLYDAALEKTSDRELTLSLLEDAAGTARDLAGDHERLMRYLEELLSLRRDARTRGALERLYERLGRKQKLIELLVGQLGEMDAPSAAAARMRVASLQLESGNAGSAFEALEQILVAEPDRADAFALLEKIVSLAHDEGSDVSLLGAQQKAAHFLESRYRAENRPGDLIRVLTLELLGAEAASEKIAKLREIVQLRLSALGDEAGALNDVAALLLLEPTENEHKETLVRLSERVGSFDRLATTLAEAAERASDPKRRVALYSEAAVIRRDKMDDVEGAISLQRAILPLAEGDRETLLEAAGELARLLGRTGRQAELCDALERLASLATDAKERRDALSQVARLAETELGDLERAVRAREAQLLSDPKDAEALDGLIDLLGRNAQFTALGNALVQRASAAGGATAAADLQRAAQIAEEKTGRVEEAIKLYERLRKMAGATAETGDALVRLYTQTQNFEALARVLEEETRSDVSPGRGSELLRKLGLVYAEHLGRPDDAVASLALACDLGNEHAPLALSTLERRLDPQNAGERGAFVAAIHALSLTYTERDDFRGLIALLPRRLLAASSPAQRVAALVETSELYEHRESDRTQAFEVMLQAFETAPSPEIATQLRRLVAATAKHEELLARLPTIVANMPSLAPHVARDLYWDVARYFREANALGAERALRLALALDPTNALLGAELCDLLRMVAPKSRALVDALLNLADVEAPLSPLLEAAQTTLGLGDPLLVRSVTEQLLSKALLVLQKKVEPPEEVPAEALHAARWGFQTLLRHANEADDRSRVLALAEQAATLPFDATERRMFLLAAAESAEQERAISIYSELFERDPNDREIAERLFELHEARGDGDALIAIRGTQIDSSPNVATRVELRLDLAARLTQAERSDAAIVVLRTSLADFPGNEATLSALSERLHGDRRFVDLTQLWEEEAARREAVESHHGAAEAWTHAARISELSLKDVVRAIRSYRRAATLEHPDALSALARLYTESGQHIEAARVLETLIPRAPATEKVTVLLALSRALVASGEPEKARRRLEAGVAEVSDAGPLRARLRDLYRVAGDFGPLAEMMAEDAEHSSDPTEKMTLLREAAEIHLERNDPARAVPLLSNALTHSSDDLSLRLLWCRALSESGRRDDALATLRTLVDAYGGRRPKERALVHHELSRALLGSGDKAKAMAELDVALRIDPAHPEILQALARLSLSEGQLDRAHKTFRALLLVARRPVAAEGEGARPLPPGMSRTEILCELSDIAGRQGEEVRASEYMESAFDAARESAMEAQRLVAALSSRNRPKDLARALSAELERSRGPEAARLWTSLAVLYEGPLADPAEAASARLSALALASDSKAHHEAARAACSRLGDSARYVAAVSELAAQSEAEGNVDQTVELLLHLGSALEAEPDGAARTIATLEQAEALLAARPLDPRLPGIWRILERSFARENNVEAIARVLEKRIQIATEGERLEPLYGLAELRLKNPDTRDLGLDLLVEATGHDADLERAEAALRRAATEPQRSARAPRLLERFARDKGRRRALLDALLLIFETEPLGEEGVREAVALAEELGDRALAQDLLRRAVERDEAGEQIDPGLRVWARVTLADVREAAGELSEASALREAAARHADPTEERALLLLVARHSAGNLDDLPRAARIYEDLRLREPADRDVWEPLADVYRRLGDASRLAALIEDTVTLIESPDERGRLRLERARLVLSQDETKAVDLLKEVLEEDPFQTEAATLLAGVLERQGMFDDLTVHLRRQIDSAKDREDATAVTELSMKLGALLERRDDEYGALDVYHQTLDWNGQSRDALRAVLRLSVKLDNSVDLGDALEKLLDVEEGDEAARLAMRLAELRGAHFDGPGAESALEAGFEKCPTDQHLLEQLAEHYAGRGAFTKLASAHVKRSRALTVVADRIAALSRAAEVLRDKAGDPAGAAFVLEEALTLDPRERHVLLALIHACDALKNPARAIVAATAALHANPEDGWLYRARASLHDSAGRPDLAVLDLMHANEKTRGAYAQDQMAALSYAVDRVSSGAALPADLPERELRIRVAEQSAALGDTDRARMQLSDLLRKDGKDKGALRALASLEDAGGHWDSASAVYRRLLSLEEGDALAATALRLADACERADRLGDARGGLERALRAAPSNAAVRERLQHLYEATSAKAELSVLLVEDAHAEADPAKRCALLIRAGRLLIEAGDGPRATQVLGEAQKLAPDSQDVVVAYAQALALAGRGVEARALLTQAAALHRGKRSKQLGIVHLTLARIEQQSGATNEALQAMLRAFDNDPQNAELAMDLGNFALELNDAETAGRAFRAVTLLKTVAPGSQDGASAAMKALAYHRLALIAHSQGDRRKARFMVEKALAEDPALEAARVLLDALR